MKNLKSSEVVITIFFWFFFNWQVPPKYDRYRKLEIVIILLKIRFKVEREVCAHWTGENCLHYAVRERMLEFILTYSSTCSNVGVQPWYSKRYNIPQFLACISMLSLTAIYGSTREWDT